MTPFTINDGKLLVTKSRWASKRRQKTFTLRAFLCEGKIQLVMLDLLIWLVKSFSLQSSEILFGNQPLSLIIIQGKSLVTKLSWGSKTRQQMGPLVSIFVERQNSIRPVRSFSMVSESPFFFYHLKSAFVRVLCAKLIVSISPFVRL